jgi:mRNA interferase MazF
MRRGDIYIVKNNRPTTGHEMAKSRPAVIVSADELNNTSEVVEVVYLTTQPKKELPTHASLSSTGRESTACCEQIDSVAVQRLGHFCGHCTDDEMEAIDDALLASLGLSLPNLAETDMTKMLLARCGDLDRIKAERDRYAKMVDLLLEAIEQ